MNAFSPTFFHDYCLCFDDGYKYYPVLIIGNNCLWWVYWSHINGSVVYVVLINQLFLLFFEVPCHWFYSEVPSLLLKFISIVFWNSMVSLILFHTFGSIVFWSYTFGSFVVWNTILLFPFFSCYCSHCIPKFHAIVSIVFWSSVLLFFCRVQLARRLKLHLRCHFLSITFNLYISIPLKYQKVSTANNPFHAEAIFTKAQDWENVFK